MAFQKYSEEKRNEILDSQQEKNARGKISLLLNLGFPKDWIEKMLPYINEDTTSWQLRMISLFDQDPEDLVAMLEDSVKNSSVEIFQSIRKKYYNEKKSRADIECGEGAVFLAQPRGINGHEPREQALCL